MIRAGAALSIEADSEAAAAAAVGGAMARGGLERADLLFLFVTPQHLSKWGALARIAAERTGGARTVGCTAYGVMTAEAEIESGPGIAALAIESEGAPAAPFLAEGLRADPLECGRAIGIQARESLGEALDAEGPPLVVILPDTYNLQAPPLFEGIHEELGPEALIVGGGASENGTLSRTFQFLDGRAVTDAVSGAVFAGGGHRFVGVSQAYQPMGEPWVVTQSERNLVHAISGRPAFEVFAEAAGPELMGDLRAAVQTVYVGIPGDPDQMAIGHGNYYVRPVVGVEPEKGILALPDPLPVGRAITFVRRDPERARADLDAMLAKGLDRPGAAALGLYFNCCGRGRSLYGEAGVDAAAIRRAAGALPVAGFFTGAEFAPIGSADHLHQYSGVLVLLGERAAGPPDKERT